MISIKRIPVSELNSLVSDPSYPQWSVIPISRHRAKSYAANPRCMATDIVLYLAYLDERLVGYRIVLPDVIFANGDAHRVCWLSGVWVDTKHRRKGIASTMLQAVLDDWDGRVLSTNFTPNSKSVIDKTKQFVEVNNLQGIRIYLKPCLARILPPKGDFFKHLKPVWVLFDFLLSVFNPLPLLNRMIEIKDVSLEYSNFPDDEVVRLFQSIMKKTPSQRSGTELKWIFDFPWLVSSPLGDRVGEKFYFSSSPNRFEQIITKVFRNGKLLGFIITNYTDGFLTTPYIMCPDEEARLFARVLLKQAFAMRCARVTTFHQAVGKSLKSLKPFGLLSIEQERKFFVTQKVFDFMGKGSSFIEGDGDCAFV
ncbi:MAG: GNAT family N-acetyltransferase [Tenuifilaceae bacterium]|nr:GNAT family N-acetyltransferase [Tenuifilaceae bacterium]